MKPPRLCALCEHKIRERDRLCDDCKSIYAEDLTSEWMLSIIEYASYEYNVQLRDYGRVIPLAQLKRNI